MKKIKIGDKDVYIEKLNSYSWEKVNCPKCEKYNWIYIGDTADLSRTDDDGFCCWQCENIFLFPFVIDEYIELENLIEIGDLMVARGLKSPIRV